MKKILFIIVCILVLASCRKEVPELIEGEWLLMEYSIEGNVFDVENEDYTLDFGDKKTVQLSLETGFCPGPPFEYKIMKIGQIEFEYPEIINGVGCDYSMDWEHWELTSVFSKMNKYTVTENDLRLENGNDYMIFSKK